MSASAFELDRRAVKETYLAQRARSRAFFDSLDESVYYTRPISLRNPFVFYEGHLPAFVVNTLLKLALGRPGVDERLEVLFARGIDPEDEAAVPAGSPSLWPAREDVLAYGAAADAAILDAIENAELVNQDAPCLVDGEAVRAILEHECMHQETLRYMAHRLPYEKKTRMPEGLLEIGEAPHPSRSIAIPEGTARLGVDPGETAFAWDNEKPSMRVEVPAFTIESLPVTNGEYLEFVRATGHALPMFWERDGEGGFVWRGMKRAIPLPLSWPVWTSGEDAAAFAAWRGRRLPTEAEWHRAAYGTPEGVDRVHPWGDARPDASRGHFDFAGTEPVPSGSRPCGASAWGVEDLVGNGWEWTATPFEGYPGFRPLASYGNYSADFFDGKHWVMKGASPVTDATLIRRTFRNWFRSEYPYVYAKFRLAGS
jgi:formylglycine-generating enzyme required for sulfatase activity